MAMINSTNHISNVSQSNIFVGKGASAIFHFNGWLFLLFLGESL